MDFRYQSSALIGQDFVVDGSFQQTALFEVGVVAAGVVQEVVQNQVAADGDVGAALLRSQDHGAVETFSELALLGDFLVVGHGQTDEVGQVRVVERFHGGHGLFHEVVVAERLNRNHAAFGRHGQVRRSQSGTGVAGRIVGSHCDHANGVLLGFGQNHASAFHGRDETVDGAFHGDLQVVFVQGAQRFHGGDATDGSEAAVCIFRLQVLGLLIQHFLAAGRTLTDHAHFLFLRSCAARAAIHAIS
ncbi:hypothetical protein D9M70_284120 [compost metagenome]